MAAVAVGAMNGQAGAATNGGNIAGDETDVIGCFVVGLLICLSFWLFCWVA